MHKNRAETQTESRKLPLRIDSEDTLKCVDVDVYMAAVIVSPMAVPYYCLLFSPQSAVHNSIPCCCTVLR